MLKQLFDKLTGADRTIVIKNNKGDEVKITYSSPEQKQQVLDYLDTEDDFNIDCDVDDLR